MSDFIDKDLNTSDDEHWLFNVDELDASRLNAPQAAKSAVAESEDVKFRNLRARKVNRNPYFGDEYVVVVKALG